MNQIFISPQGQLLGPQGQALGYTVVQTPQGLVAVPNQQQLGGQRPPDDYTIAQTSRGLVVVPNQQQAAAPALGQAAPAAGGMGKLLLAVALLGGGYWIWTKYVRPKTSAGRGDVLRERRSRRSRSRLLAEVKRFLETHPEMREELRDGVIDAQEAQEAEEEPLFAGEAACEACEDGGDCADHAEE